MKFTNEQLAKAKAAKSAEELIALAKENGLELTEEEAKNYFEQWHKEGELADDELDNVSGGCGDPDPKYGVGTEIIFGCMAYEILEILEYNEYRGYLYKCKSKRTTYNEYGVLSYVITELYEDMID